MGVIRTQRQVGSIGPVGVVRSRSSGQFQRIAAATNKLTELAVGEMGRQAAKRGKELAEQESVSRITTLDPITNKPEALSWIGDNNFVGRVGKEAYEETIAKRFQFEIDNKLKIKANELAIKYQFKDGGSELFKEQMHQYIDNMATASEATGYSNYIMQSGVSLVTTTSLNMMDKEFQREFAKTTAILASGIDESTDAIETLASQGAFDQAKNIQKDVGNTSSRAQTSNHFTEAEAEGFNENAAFAYARGVFRYEMQNVNSDEATNIYTAILSGSLKGLDKTFNAREIEIINNAVDGFTKTVEIDGKEVLVQDFESVKALAPFIEGQIKRIKNEENTNALLKSFEPDEFSDIVNDAGSIGTSVISDDDLYPTPESKVDEILKRYNLGKTQLEKIELNDPVNRVGEPSHQAQLADIRIRISKNLLLEAYNDLQDTTKLSSSDIVKVLEEAFRTENTGEQFSQFLKGNTKAAMEVIKQLGKEKGGINVQTITTYITALGQFDFRKSEQERIKTEVEQNDLIESIIADPVDRYDEGIELINNSTLSQTQKNNKKTALNAARVDLMIRKVIQNDSDIISDNLSDAVTYASTGKERQFLTEELKAVVDEAKQFLNEDQIASILTSKASDLNTSEANAATGSETRNIQSVILGGGITSNTTKEQEAAEKLILGFANMGPEFFTSEDMFATNPDGSVKNPAAIFLMQSIHSGTIPTTLKNLYERMASGIPMDNPEHALNLITFFEQASSQPVSDVANVDLISPVLGNDTATRLKAIATVRVMTNESINQVADRLNQTDIEETRNTIQKKFGQRHKKKELTVDDFVALEVDDAKNNSQAIQMLGSYALYMGALGMNADNIASELKTYYNQMFSDTEGYTLDAASLSGESSRYSFNHLFTDSRIKEFFIKKVNRELVDLMPEGEALMISSNKSPVSNRAYLLPYGVEEGGGVRFMVVRNDNGNLVPVYSKAGLPIGFSTDEDDVLDEAKRINKEKYIKNYTLEEINKIRSDKERAEKIRSGLITDVGRGYTVPEDVQGLPYAGAGQ